MCQIGGQIFWHPRYDQNTLVTNGQKTNKVMDTFQALRNMFSHM